LREELRREGERERERERVLDGVNSERIVGFGIEHVFDNASAVGCGADRLQQPAEQNGGRERIR
jgi:hypothetical protein